MGLLGFLMLLLIWDASRKTAELAYFQDTAVGYFGQNDRFAIRLHRGVAGTAALVGMCVALSFAGLPAKHTGDYGPRRLNGQIAFIAGTMSAFAGTVVINIGYETYRDLT